MQYQNLFMTHQVNEHKRGKMRNKICNNRFTTSSIMFWNVESTFFFLHTWQIDRSLIIEENIKENRPAIILKVAKKRSKSQYRSNLHTHKSFLIVYSYDE